MIWTLFSSDGAASSFSVVTGPLERSGYHDIYHFLEIGDGMHRSDDISENVKKAFKFC
jgi:hypothetical protein